MFLLRAISESWMTKYSSAKKYYEKHGNLFVPVGYLDETTLLNNKPVELYIFIQQNRLAYKGKGNVSLSQEKIDLLNAIGMVWDMYEYNWNKNYELCKIFYNTHGHLRIPQNYMYEDVNLGTWIVNQRLAYFDKIGNNLTEEKIAKLNDIEMVWDATNNVWDSNFLLLNEFYNEHGHIDVPNNYMVQNVNLGKWLQNQRVLHKKGRLSNEHYEKLNNFNMIWDKIEYRWEYFYKLAQKYYEEHGDLLVPQHYHVDGSHLGVWISNQRQYYKGNVQNSNLTEERISKLNALGMVWSLSDKPRIENRPPKVNIYDEAWNEKYEIVKDYLKDHDKIKTELVINGIKIGRWYHAQKQAVKGGNKLKLNKERIQKLKDIGIF